MIICLFVSIMFEEFCVNALFLFDDLNIWSKLLIELFYLSFDQVWVLNICEINYTQLLWFILNYSVLLIFYRFKSLEIMFLVCNYRMSWFEILKIAFIWNNWVKIYKGTYFNGAKFDYLFDLGWRYILELLQWNNLLNEYIYSIWLL